MRDASENTDDTRNGMGAEVWTKKERSKGWSLCADPWE